MELGLNDGANEGFKGAFLYGAGVTSTYDSNFFLTENNPDGELITGFSGMIAYFSDPEGGAPLSITANYSPTIQTYLENSENNAIDFVDDFKNSMSEQKLSKKDKRNNGDIINN